MLYLPFDKPDDGGVVHDESGAGNIGKVFGAQWVPDGKFGGAYHFSLTNLDDRIVLPNSDTLNPDSITIAAWIKAADKDGFWNRIVDKGCASGWCMCLGGDYKGKGMRGKLWAEGSGLIGVGSNHALDDNRWHHVAITFDGKINSSYIDGVKEKSWSGKNPGPLKKNDWDLCIGNSVVDYGTGELLAFDGLIDEVRIYNRALSGDEIQALATATRAGVDMIGATETPEQRAADKLRARRVNTLNDALRYFQNTSDVESLNLVSNLLASFVQSGEITTNALMLDMERMKSRVHALVRRGDLDSAGSLNHAQSQAFYTMDFPGGPTNPSKSGGPPGPGGLVLYLPFDKPDLAGVVHDESGAGNDGQVFGAQWVPAGKFGGAYHFSVTNFDDRIVIPNGDSLNPDYITVAAWIKASPAHLGLWERILDKDFDHGYAFSLAGDGNLTGKLALETGQRFIGSDRAPDDNQWHHVAAAYDGQNMRCYIDGAETSRRTRRPGPMSKSGWDLCIGNSVVDYGWGELMAFDGLIDEVRIYNRALSPAEIKALAMAAHAGVDVIGSPADTPKADPAERLKKLKSLYEQGLINQDDYDKKVKEIMDSL